MVKVSEEIRKFELAGCDVGRSGKLLVSLIGAKGMIHVSMSFEKPEQAEEWYKKYRTDFETKYKQKISGYSILRQYYVEEPIKNEYIGLK